MIKVITKKWIKLLNVFTKELSSLRTGRANSNMLRFIKVDVYGQKMPINQIGTITTFLNLERSIFKYGI